MSEDSTYRYVELNRDTSEELLDAAVVVLAEAWSDSTRSLEETRKLVSIYKHPIRNGKLQGLLMMKSASPSSVEPEVPIGTIILDLTGQQAKEMFELGDSDGEIHLTDFAQAQDDTTLKCWEENMWYGKWFGVTPAAQKEGAGTLMGIEIGRRAWESGKSFGLSTEFPKMVERYQRNGLKVVSCCTSNGGRLWYQMIAPDPKVTFVSVEESQESLAKMASMLEEAKRRPDIQ